MPVGCCDSWTKIWPKHSSSTDRPSHESWRAPVYIGLVFRRHAATGHQGQDRAALPVEVMPSVRKSMQGNMVDTRSSPFQALVLVQDVTGSSMPTLLLLGERCLVPSAQMNPGLMPHGSDHLPASSHQVIPALFDRLFGCLLLLRSTRFGRFAERPYCASSSEVVNKNK
jgi:hypothetical protein